MTIDAFTPDLSLFVARWRSLMRSALPFVALFALAAGCEHHHHHHHHHDPVPPPRPVSIETTCSKPLT